MSTPDARLTAAERAAFANLEAAAAAADPTLAARLRGRAHWRSHPSIRATATRALHLWAVMLGLRVWGGPLVVIGFLLMALGLGAGLAVSLLGVAMALLGLRMVAESARIRMVTRRAGRPEDRRVDG